MAINVCIYGHTYSKSMDQPGKVANPARGQLNRENQYFLSAFAPENLVPRDGFGSPVPCQPAHLHTLVESGAYLRDSSRVPRRRPFIYLKPPYAIGSVPSLLDHANAYRWRSLPRYTCVCVCVCFFPFILDTKFVGRTSRGHTGGRSHRISHPPSFCGACLNFSREKDSAIPFPRRP